MSASTPHPRARPARRAHRPPVGVDVHAHLLPASAVRAERDGVEWFGSTFESAGPDAPPVVRTGDRRVRLGAAVHREPPERRIAAMDAAGVARQVISLLPPLFRYELPADTALAAAREVNDEIAGMVRARPHRFAGLATLPLPAVRECLEEMERAMSLGLAGFAIGTHVSGLRLDAPELRPIFRRASEYGAFVLCHPVNPRAAGPAGAAGALDRFYLSNVVGNPLETTLAFCDLVLGGVLDEAPGMRLCLVHGGGYVPAAAGRLDHAHRVRPETAGSARPPSAYLRSVYFDTLTHDRRGLVDLVGRVGADRVLLGSDYPADMGAADPVGQVLDAGLDADQCDAILHGNAERILRPSGAARTGPPGPDGTASSGGHSDTLTSSSP